VLSRERRSNHLDDMGVTRRQLFARSSLSAATLFAWAPMESEARRRQSIGRPARAHAPADPAGAVNILYANAGGLQPAVADLPTIAKSPFDVVLEYSVGGADTLPFADAAQRAGLKVLWDVRSLATWNGGPSLLDQLDAHPATFGFYVAEEPTDRAPVQQVCSLLGSRNHPRVAATFSYDGYGVGRGLAPLVGLADMITCAAYMVGVALDGPAGCLPFSNVTDIAREMSKAAAHHGFTPAVTMQAFAWNQDPTMAMTPDFGRWPTFEEMVAMRKHALGGGVSDLFWFTRWAVTRAFDPAGRWSDVCAAARGAH
jgi:hypothetical protein